LRPPFLRPQGTGLPSDFNFASQRMRPACRSVALPESANS